MNSLIKFIIGLIFFSFSFLLPAEISLDVNLIKTGQYNVSDFLDPSVSLWTVNINCTDCTIGDLVSYRIEVRLNFNEINPAIWGITHVRNVSYENPSDVLTNFDFQGGEGLLYEYNQDEVFISLLEENYYLPAGTVSLNVRAFLCETDLCENLEINISNASVSGTMLASDQEIVQNNVVSELNLLSPANNADVLDPYPWLRWESPGFLNGVKIDYTLYVYLFDPLFQSSYIEAIEDDNFLYFTKEINQYETGIPQQIQVQYPTDDRDLACGYQYVWYVKARDIIQDSPFNGESGIWGWPEPIESPLYVFNYGSIINAANVVSPSIGSEISTVRPSFYVDPIDCADSYEIWLSHKEDSEVENPLWVSSALQSNVNVYPSDATGLMPGSDYKWKIRVNPDGVSGPWSDIFNFKVGGYTLDDPISGIVLNTISPTFYFTGPSDIAGFELRISNSDDPTVEYGNIFNEYVQSFPFELPTDIPVGLLSGSTYYWKLIFFDGNENIVGEIDDYTIVESFSIAGIEIISPSNGVSDLSLTPSFMWDGPIGVSQYEFSLSTDDDPSLDNPIFTTNVSGTYFQYPQYGDYPLEYEQLYYWKIVPLDLNDNRGSSSEYYSFSTATDLTQANSEEVSSTKPEFSLSSGPNNSPKDIIVNLLTDVSGADEYIIYFSNDQEMGSFLAEITLEIGQTEAILNGEDFDWGLTVYVQVIAMVDGEIFGEESSIQIINLPEKPGSDEQVGISISLEGSEQLVIEITNGITNTDEYILEITTDAEMTEIYFVGTVFEDMPTVYPESADPLMSGETYFIHVYATDDEGLHGIPSSVISIFIPNILPPILIDEYSWEATVPASNSYTIQISTTDDFLSIVVEENIYGTSFTLPVKTLDPGTGYYWRVQGFDLDDNPFGNASSIVYFATDPIPTPMLNSISETTSLLPEFSWNGIDQATSYLIDVSSDSNMETILWSYIITVTNTIYDETALLLKYANSYYWRISTLSDDGEVLSVSSIESFSTTSIFPVTGLSPNGGTETFTPTLEWKLNNNYSSYKIIISEDKEFGSIIFNSIVETSNILVNEEGLLQSGITYYWKVEGLDSNGENPAGPSETTILVMPSLNEIPIISPREDEQVSNLTPQLKWGSLENTSSYTLKVATDAGLESIIIDETVSGTEYQIPEDKILKNKMIYYWQIEVVTGAGMIKSKLGKFSTPSVAEIGILSLDDGAAISITNPIFSWEGIQGVSAYNIQFSTNPDFSESWSKLSGSSNFEYPSEPPLGTNTSYYWRVCALSNEGEQIGAWTTARTFTISEVFIVQLELPPSGEPVTTKKPTLSWGAIEGVSKYEIRISANEDYSQIMWQSSNVAQNSVQYPSSGAETLLVETVYYWSVRAIAEDVALGDFCESFTFTVSEDNKPVLTGPMNGLSESILPFFTWNKIPKANSYGLVLGNNEDLSQVIFENQSISDNKFQYVADAPPLEYNTAYYWKVIAYDENGAPLGDYSLIATFTTPTGIIQIEFIYEAGGE